MPVHAAYPHEGNVSMMHPAYGSSSPPGNSLKITIVVFGVIGMLIWCTSIGFMVAWGYGYYSETPREIKIFYGNGLSIPANAGMIYVTARILYLVMEEGFPLPGSVQDLSRCASRMLAFTMLGFTGWVGSVIWLSIDDTDNFKMYHACNYGFVIAAVVTILAGALVSTSRKVQRQAMQHLKNTAPHLQAHYNPAFAPPYTEHA